MVRRGRQDGRNLAPSAGALCGCSLHAQRGPGQGPPAERPASPTSDFSFLHDGTIASLVSCCSSARARRGRSGGLAAERSPPARPHASPALASALPGELSPWCALGLAGGERGEAAGTAPLHEDRSAGGLPPRSPAACPAPLSRGRLASLPMFSLRCRKRLTDWGVPNMYVKPNTSKAKAMNHVWTKDTHNRPK